MHHMVSAGPTDVLVRRSWNGRECRIELQGELDIASAPRLVHELEAAEARRPVRIVVDLSGLGFIDSSGLHALLAAQQRAASAAHEFRLTRGPRNVQRLFTLSGTEALLQFVD